MQFYKSNLKLYFKNYIAQAFNTFCELHPILEYLHIAINADDFLDDVENPVLFHGKWKLLHLKKLVYDGDYWPLEQGKPLYF